MVGPGGPAAQSRGARPGPPSGAGWWTRPGPIPGSETARLLRRLGVADGDIRVFPSQTAAWAAAADGAGVAPAIEHLVSHRLRRGELSLIDLPGFRAKRLVRDRARAGAAQHCRERAAPVLGTPEAMQVMRSPAAGVSPSRFKPPVYVTIWS